MKKFIVGFVVGAVSGVAAFYGLVVLADELDQLEEDWRG